MEPFLRAAPDHPGAWAETPKLSAVREKQERKVGWVNSSGLPVGYTQLPKADLLTFWFLLFGLVLVMAPKG